MCSWAVARPRAPQALLSSIHRHFSVRPVIHRAPILPRSRVVSRVTSMSTDPPGVPQRSDIMTAYAVDAEQIAAASAQACTTASTIRTEVDTMMGPAARPSGHVDRRGAGELPGDYHPVAGHPGPDTRRPGRDLLADAGRGFHLRRRRDSFRVPVRGGLTTTPDTLFPRGEHRPRMRPARTDRNAWGRDPHESHPQADQLNAERISTCRPCQRQRRRHRRPEPRACRRQRPRSSGTCLRSTQRSAARNG